MEAAPPSAAVPRWGPSRKGLSGAGRARQATHPDTGENEQTAGAGEQRDVKPGERQAATACISGGGGGRRTVPSTPLCT